MADMSSDHVQYTEIVDLNDELLLPWLDLYETSFPPHERILVSGHLRVLQARAAGVPTDEHLLAAIDEAGAMVGMARVLIRPDEVAYLWYLAVSPAARNRGLGSTFYREIVRRAEEAGCRALIFEVEIPEREADEERRRLAQRRIGFYRRLGARLLAGIHYLQSVGPHQPPTPMHIMVHGFSPLDPQDAFLLAQALFGDAVTATGTLILE